MIHGFINSCRLLTDSFKSTIWLFTDVWENNPSKIFSKMMILQKKGLRLEIRFLSRDYFSGARSRFRSWKQPTPCSWTALVVIIDGVQRRGRGFTKEAQKTGICYLSQHTPKAIYGVNQNCKCSVTLYRLFSKKKHLFTEVNKYKYNIDPYRDYWVTIYLFISITVNKYNYDIDPHLQIQQSIQI